MIRISGKIIILGTLLLLPAFVFSQESHTLNTKDYFIPHGTEYLANELYGLSLHSFEGASINDENIAGTSISSFRLDETRSIDLLLESIARSSDARENNQIYAIIANKYFARKEFKTAREYYKKVNDRLLSPEQYSELNFKLAYTLLLEKKFSDAKGYFSKSKKYHSVYKDHATYYIGICSYFLNQKEEAISSFEAVENNKKYRDLIPYYLAQIYFKEENYDEAIRYAEKKLSDARMTNKAHIYKILGLSYLAKSNFSKSLEYLDAYAQESPKLTENEFYQIGVSHYKLGNYNEAKSLFSELSHQDTKIGQVANFLLGSIYLNDGEQKNAQSAFKQASKYNFFPDIREESQFLYYKLSAELGEERVAMNGLSSVTESSPYFHEARDLLAEVLLRSKDHVAAIGTIENLTHKSDKMLNSYKNLTYDFAIQNLQDGQISTAIDYLKISRDTPGDEQLQSNATFWLAHALDKNEQFSESSQFLDEYLAGSHQDYKFRAHYLKSYHNISEKAFNDARHSLEQAVSSFDVEKDQKTLFDDAIVRLADLELLDNNYLEAISYYDLAIENNAVESDYILYQKALIYGVINEDLDKLTSLESLIRKYPDSEYRDDALFEIGESLLSLQKNNEAFKIYQAVINEFGEASEYAPLAFLRQGLISYNQGDIISALKFYKKGLNISDDPELQRQALFAIEEIYLNDMSDPDGYFDFVDSDIGFELEEFKRDSISYQLGYRAYQESRFNQAIDAFRNYEQKYSEGLFLEDAWYYLAESYVLTKEYLPALKYYERLLKDPGSKYFNASIKKASLIAFNHVKDFEKSHLLFKQWIASGKDVGQDVYESALYSAHVIGNDEYIQSYASWLIDNETTSTEKKSAAWFYMGKSLERTGKTNEAMIAYKMVSQFSSNKQAAEASFSVAKILYNKGQLEEAEAQAFETTRKSSNYPLWVAKCLILIGDIYTDRHDYLNASAAYESVIENFKENQDVLNEAQSKLDILNREIKESSRVKDEEKLDLIQQDSIR